MSFFKDMGIFEKVAFSALSPIIFPVAAAIALHAKITKGEPFWDSETSSAQSEQEARERVERQTKEKLAAAEREAIVDYAQRGLLTLQAVHSITERPITISLSFPMLKTAVRSTEPSIEILGRWVPQSPGSDLSSILRKEIGRLNEEVAELKQLRQAVLELQPEETSA